MKGMHGGDIYRNHVRLDFSVNVNPLGMPKEVEAALQEAVAVCGNYPDIRAQKLTQAVSDMLGISPEYLLFGNGASELFMAIVHALRPKKTFLPVPSFYGYEHALKAIPSEVIYYFMREEDMFCITDAVMEYLTEETDMLFLANPNNPVGNLLSKEFLKKLLWHCKEKGIVVVLDECFIEFCGSAASMLSELKQYDNLVIVRAFTKIFAIPGVRLGYLVCSNQFLLEKIKGQLPEWNLSVFAQAAGCVCAGQSAFVKKTADFVRQERKFLADSLREMGFRVFPGEANFLMFHSEQSFYERLLKQGILIRDCSNFMGLSEGYYRMAVRSRAENEQLIKVIGA